MPDQTQVSRTIDELVMSPISREQRRRAALTICLTLSNSGHTTSEIRDVLECLDLLN